MSTIAIDQSKSWFACRHEGKASRINLTDSPTVFGRAGACDVQIASPQMSRRHFKVEWVDGKWILEDLQSRFGTFVNGAPVKRVVLNAGDRVTIGSPLEVLLVLEFQGASAGVSGDHDSVVIDETHLQPKVGAMIEVSRMPGDTRRGLPGTGGSDGPPLIAGAEGSAESHRGLIRLFGQMGDVLLSAAPLDEILQQVLDLTMEQIPAGRGSICLCEESTGKLIPKAARRGVSRAPIHISRTIVEQVLLHRRALLVGDLGQDDRFNASDSILELKIHSALCAPMCHRGRVLGLVYLDRAAVQGANVPELTADHLELLTSIAVFAAAGIERARLQLEFQKEQQLGILAHGRIHVLLEVAKSLCAELNTSALIEMIMLRARELLDGERCTLFIADRETNELWSRVAEGTGVIRVPMSKGIAGHVATTGETINIADAYADPRFNPEVDRATGFRTRSILCMPLRNKESRVVGVTQMINKRAGSCFTEEDERLLEAFSAQATVALENAQLFQQTLGMRNHLESILKSITNSVLTLDTSGRLVTANRSVGPLLGVDAEVARTQPYTRWFNGANAGFVADITRVYADPRPVYAAEYEFQVGARSVSTNYSIVPLLDFAQVQAGVVVVVDDITREKRMKATLGRYMSPALAEQVLQDEKSRLGGVRQRVTVLFSDIRGYTTFTESMDASEVVEMLNQYFGYMVDAVDLEQGVLDKFIGDAIMALYGVPFPREDDTVRACRTALRMKEQLLLFNAQRALTGSPAIQIGIGLNTGMVVSGNIGSEKRVDYTCIGDSVNLASRLEGATKIYGVTILLSEYTYEEVKDRFVIRELDRIRVKGKQNAVGLYELLGREPSDVSPRLLSALPDFRAALQAYRQQNWALAIQLFGDVFERSGDPAARLFLQRCKAFQVQPPAPDWDGVWELIDKYPWRRIRRLETEPGEWPGLQAGAVSRAPSSAGCANGFLRRLCALYRRRCCEPVAPGCPGE